MENFINKLSKQMFFDSEIFVHYMVCNYFLSSKEKMSHYKLRYFKHLRDELEKVQLKKPTVKAIFVIIGEI